jgi:hypothetical protein
VSCRESGRSRPKRTTGALPPLHVGATATEHRHFCLWLSCRVRVLSVFG